MRLVAATMATVITAAAPAAASSMPPVDAPGGQRVIGALGLPAASADWQVAPGLFAGAVGMFTPLGPPKPIAADQPMPVLLGLNWGPPAVLLGPRLTWRFWDWRERQIYNALGLSAAGGVSSANGWQDLWGHLGLFLAIRTPGVRVRLGVGPATWLVRDPRGGWAYQRWWHPFTYNGEFGFPLDGDRLELIVGGNALAGNALVGLRAAL